MGFQPVFVANQNLAMERYSSSLKSEAVSGGSTISVYSITEFSINLILLIGEFGSEQAEIILTHAATAPSVNTVTLASALRKDHPKDTKVYIIPFDKVEISWCATETGSKDVLATISINPEEIETIYDDTTNTSGYYFSRYKNSITNVFSNYTDPYPFTGLPLNTVGAAIQSAMAFMGAEFSKTLTYQVLIDETNNFLSDVRGRLKKWSNFQETGSIVGTLTAGVVKLVMPDTIYDKNSNKSVISVKIGKNDSLKWISRKEYLDKMSGSSYTEVATQPSVGDTTLVLDDTSDLDDDGSIDVFVSGVKYTVEYTDNDRTTNTLSGIAASGDGSIEFSFPVDSQVLQGVDYNYPQFYNVYDGYLYLYPMIDEDQVDHHDRNILMDFYTDIVRVDSAADVIQATRYDALTDYLKYVIRCVRDRKGLGDSNDPHYLSFERKINRAVINDDNGELRAFRPRRFASNNRNSNQRDLGRIDY